MGETEAVQRVVFEARQFARPDSQVDEREWFEAGEPDTEPTVLVDRRELVYQASTVPAQRPRWGYVIAAGAFAIGLAIGYRLGAGW